MTIHELLNIHGRVTWRQLNPQTTVQGLCTDSRQVGPGFVFVAVRGSRQDGHDFLPQAANAGAIALVVEDAAGIPSDYSGAVVEVLDARLALQALAKHLHGSPGDRLRSVGVTGTNGKTSTVYILEHLLASLGLRCGVIGTINHHFEDKVWETQLTSPDPVTLQRRLADFVSLGADAFAMEISSHALAQDRVQQGIDVCIFTNLSRDHLDYHGTMEDYFKSKLKLFSPGLCKEGGDNFAVINGDDPMGQRAIEYAGQSRQVLSFGKGLSHDFCFELLSSDLLGVEFQLKGPRGQTWRVRTPLLGEHNVYNLVGALVALYALGGDLQRALKAWPNFPGVPGRLQRISREDLNIHCFVDYAHTPDALEQVLKTLRKLVHPGQTLITLFGCGGDRDPGKRPLMGEVASYLSDGLWLTSDNPRSEDPHRILLDIQAGVKSGVPLRVEADRGRAIDELIQSCRGGEVILVAGKGHEKTQTIGKQVLPFDDFQRVQSALQRKVHP